MAKATIDQITTLETTLAKAASALPKVTSKKMFGCQAYWVNDNVFALVWKEGRIGFKLPNETSYDSLMKSAGSAPWKAGPMQMAHWVLVPESFHSKAADLKKWAQKAYDECAVLEKKPAKKKAVPKKKKVVKKRS
jgi:TfoX/Sxy family transcriptional regulator of competence genes